MAKPLFNALRDVEENLSTSLWESNRDEYGIPHKNFVSVGRKTSLLPTFLIGECMRGAIAPLHKSLIPLSLKRRGGLRG